MVVENNHRVGGVLDSSSPVGAEVLEKCSDGLLAGLVNDLELHQGEITANGANDCTRVAPVLLEPEVNWILLGHPDFRPFLPHVSRGLIDVDYAFTSLHVVHQLPDFLPLPVDVLIFSQFPQMPLVAGLEITDAIPLVNV